MSRWADIFKHLKDRGFDVYSPGQHQGECTSPYVVVKDQGRAQLGQFSSARHLYDLLCYVPRDQYSTLDGFVTQVEHNMLSLYPTIKSGHYRTPSFYDDSVKGHMVSTQYINYEKL